MPTGPTDDPVGGSAGEPTDGSAGEPAPGSASSPSPAHRRLRAGGSALAFGLVSVAFAVVPVIGDIVSVPTALVAVVLGMIGAGHYDAGRAPRLLPALLGALLGGVSLLITVVTMLAAGPLG